MGSGAPPSLGPRGRCAKHTLAVGPDGLCALCRSESLPPARPLSLWLLSGLLLAILVVTGSVSAYRAVASFKETHAAGVATLSNAAPPAAPVLEAPASAEAPDTDVTAAPEPRSGESVPLAEVLPSAIAPAIAELPVAEAPPSLPSAPHRAPPSQAELQAAYSATPIVMYSASWCGVCRKAKRFLTENGLKYREIDADETPGTWDEIERMTGRKGVPVIIVDGERTPSGLSPANIMRAVSRSMERRLGISGIQVKPS